MRQACIALILGQLGCEVPAHSATFTPVDRIFSRIGASDQIMRHESTFMVECKEAAHTMAHASARSLVIMDELGRGTSTFDGTAIAMAVLEELQSIDCLTLFSTHCHVLINSYKEAPGIALYHMTSREEDVLPFASSTATSPSHSSQAATALLKDVTFLYKFEAGVSPKSFGLNVARMAGVKAEVLTEAAHMAALCERRMVIQLNRDKAAGQQKADIVKEGGQEKAEEKAEAKAKVKGRKGKREKLPPGWTAEQAAALRKVLRGLNIADAYEAGLKAADQPAAGAEQ